MKLTIKLYSYEKDFSGSVWYYVAGTDSSFDRAWICGNGLVKHGLLSPLAWPNEIDFKVFLKDPKKAGFKKFVFQLSSRDLHYSVESRGKINSLTFGFGLWLQQHLKQFFNWELIVWVGEGKEVTS